MHEEAMRWLDKVAAEIHVVDDAILDVGGRDVNGTPRTLFPRAVRYSVCDLAAGDNVDTRCDARVGLPRAEGVHGWDVVLSTEVFEHVAGWPLVVSSMATVVRSGGWLVVTTATDPREPHSGIDGGPVREGEWYRNVDSMELMEVLGLFVQIREIEIDPRGDVYAYGQAP